MNHSENTVPIETCSREAYESVTREYEETKAAIGGDKTDEELLALMAARTNAGDKLALLYNQAWDEAIDRDADLNQVAAFAKLSRREQLQELLRREFSRGVEHIPEGRFTSDLPGVEQLTVLHHQKSADKVPSRSFAVYVSHVDPKTEKRSAETFTITNEGHILGIIPRGWDFTKEKLTEEIVHLVDDVGGTFFVDTADMILPPGNWERGESGGKEGSRGTKEEIVDRRRLRFFKNQPGALFGFRGAASTQWEGYHGFAFRDRIVLDAPKVGNAVYILPLSGEFPVSPEQLSLPPGFRVGKEERERYLSKHWTPFVGLTKMESLEGGATRIIHPDYATVDDQWEKKMREKLDR